MTDGYALAFWVMVAFAVAAVLATLLLVRREELAQSSGDGACSRQGSS